MLHHRSLIFLFLLTTATQQLRAAGTEEERLSGFAEHQNRNSQFDKARKQGERGFLEEAEQWENQRQRELKSYKGQKKAGEMTEDGPEAQEDTAAKKKGDAAYEATRRQFIEEKSKQERFSRANKNLPSEEHELGLDIERPRYEYRKRAAFGAKPKFGHAAAVGGSSSGGSSGGGFPTPPPFDDFGGSGGYVPAPNLPEDFGDVPPPPPPPPPPAFGDDTLGGGFNSDFPPPPPPPPGFGDGLGDF